MKLKDMGFWEGDFFEGCEIECPECCKYTAMDKWIETEVGCEDCGSHYAIMCPECEEYFDHVYSPEFNTRPGEQNTTDKVQNDQKGNKYVFRK